MTHQESGYVQEITLEAGLKQSKNLWVDGSLRNMQYFKMKFAEIRHRFPEYRIGILHVDAPKEAVLARALARGKITGRFVPEELLLAALEQVPKSVTELSHWADYSATINNTGHSPPEFVGGHPVFEKLTFAMHFRPTGSTPESERKGVQMSRQVEVALGSIFSLMDRNQNGSISRAEGRLMTYAAGQDEERAVQTWNAMLHDADQDGNGELTREEWMEYCKGCPTFQRVCNAGGECGEEDLLHATQLLDVVAGCLKKKLFLDILISNVNISAQDQAQLLLPGHAERLVFHERSGTVGLERVERFGHGKCGLATSDCDTCLPTEEPSK